MRDTARILYVLHYLQEKSDEQHPLSTRQILDHLETKGITAHRKTVPRDVKLLMDFGVDIVTVKSTQNLYFVGERHFELPELKVLIDAVSSSKFITPKKSDALINKLRELMSEYQKTEFAGKSSVTDQVKPKNESIYIIADTIQSAIIRKKQITFRYYEYLADKSKVLKHDGYRYSFSPYDFVWNEDKYYVFGYSKKHEKVVKFRVDRMCEVRISEADSIPCPEDFLIAAFCRQVFGMYDGKRVTVELKCKSELMKVIIDKFGEEVNTEVIGGGWFKAATEVCISPAFFGWLFQFTGKMILTAPAEAVGEYAETLKKALEII